MADSSTDTSTTDTSKTDTSKTDTTTSAPEMDKAPDGWTRDKDGGITAVDVPWKGYV